MIFSNRSGNHVEAFRFKGEYCVDYSRHQDCNCRFNGMESEIQLPLKRLPDSSVSSLI